MRLLTPNGNPTTELPAIDGRTAELRTVLRELTRTEVDDPIHPQNRPTSLPFGVSEGPGGRQQAGMLDKHAVAQPIASLRSVRWRKPGNLIVGTLPF